MNKQERRLTWGKLAAYIIVFYAIWTAREFYMRQQIDACLGEWWGALVNGGIKVLIWTVPAWLLIRRHPDDVAIPDVFAGSVPWPSLLLWMGGLVLFSVVSAFFANGSLRFQADFRPSQLIGTVLLVGITEEMTFRGLFLNALLKRAKQNTALIITAVLFVLIHFPIWYTKGIFATPITLLRSCVSIFALSLLFSLAFIRTRNLWPPILLHMAWNLGALVFFG